MAKKEITDKNIKEIKKLLKSKEIVIGFERTVRNLRNGSVKKVFVASNCSEKARDDVERYCRIGGAEFVELGYPDEELGVVCKKPFSISVISILKGEK